MLQLISVLSASFAGFYAPMGLLRAQGVLFIRLQMHAMLFDMFFEYANVSNTRLSKPCQA